MKNFITTTTVLIYFLIPFQAFGKGQLVATPINSPVKETYLKVKLEGLSDISSVYFSPKNGGNEIEGIVYKEGSVLVGKFRVSYLLPGSFNYRIRTRSTSGNSDESKASSIAFIKFTIDSSVGVADPGEDGKKTLLGIDTNSNGVRDDIERWINETESNSDIKKAMFEQAKAIQLTLANKDNKDLSIRYTFKGLKAQHCLRYLRSDKGASTMENIEKNTLLLTMMTNTRERIYAKQKVSSNFHGQTVSRIPKNLACQF